MSIFSLARNPINSYVKSLHSHAIESLVSMTLTSILKESCIRFVWGMFYEFDDVVTTIYDVILYNLKYLLSVNRNPRNPDVKLLHSHDIESLVSMTLDSILKEYCIIFVWGMFYEFDNVVTDIFDVLLYNFMSLCSVGWNRRNPYVKLLQFHATNSLVFMYLTPILNELYTRLVWGDLYDV